MPLTFAKIGETKVISSFQGKEEVKRHLQDLGFTVGEEVKVVTENDSGFILIVKGVRLALNKGLVSKIMVN
jgi:Fe2+ transport system protein A